MRKRVLSFLVVLVLVFTGAFSCFASAASRSPGEFLFDMYWELIHKGEQAIEDIWNIGRESREDAERDLRQILFDQKDFDNGTFIPGSSVVVSFTNGSSLVYDCSKSNLFSIIGAPGISSDYYWFVTAHNVSNNRYSSPTNTATFCTIYFLLVPKNADFTYSLSVDSSYFNLNYSGPCINGRLDGRYSSSSGSFFRVSLNNNRLNSNVNYSDYGNITHGTTSDNFPLYSDFDSQALTFTGTFSTVDDLVCTVESSRPLSHDGTFSIMTGILFDDGTYITYAGSFVNAISTSSGQRWSWSYDLDDFAYYVYRKRCGLDNYYAFISVTQDSDTCYFVTMPLEINKPGGIFDDVEDPPNWEDYRPEPTPAPEFPTITFDFHPNVSYQAIANYSVDANATFNDYFTYFVDASTTINNNINIATENIIEFGEAFSDFINDSFNDVITYIGDTITVVNSDIISNIDAIGEFIGDLVSSINFNAQLIIDNLKKYFDTKFIPDSEYIEFLLSDCIGWYSQIQGLLAEKDFSADSFTLYLAPFDYTFVFDDAELAGYIKSFCNVMCLAFTAIQCVRIGFQIFGISIGGDSNDS